MSSESNNSTQRKMSNHDTIMLDPEDSDTEWTFKKQKYKSIVDDYRELSIKKKEIASIEAKLNKSCVALKKDLANDNKPERQHVRSCMETFCDEKMIELPSVENGFLLWLVIGKLNVRFCDFDLKMQYKKSYERFKLIANGIAVTLVMLTWLFNFPEIIVYSLLVGYYFTLTIREHILIKNGSKIKRWWLIHHYITIVITFLLLTWPPGECYEQLHDTLMFSILMTSVIQLVQFFYQRKTIDRNIMMGKDRFLRTTNEGIRSKLLSDLVYIVPLLIFLYIVQAYTSWSLFVACYTGVCMEYQVPILATMFLFLCLGNCKTLFQILRQKAKLAKEKQR